MGKPSAPSAPNFSGDSKRQAEAYEEAVARQMWANRPTVYTPFGSMTWVADKRKDPGSREQVTTFDQTITLDPEMQRALESQQRTQTGRSLLAEGLIERAGQEIGDPSSLVPMYANDVYTGFLGQPQTIYNDWRKLPVQHRVNPNYDVLDRDLVADRNLLSANQIGDPADIRDQAETALYDRAASRLDPAWEQREEQVQNQLWNQGLRPGDEAYDAAMGNFERARADAYNQAQFGAIIGGGEEAQRQLGMDLSRRQQARREADVLFGQDLAQRQQMRGEGDILFQQELARRQQERAEAQQLYGRTMGIRGLEGAEAQQQFGRDMQRRQQAWAEELARRGMTINEMNALMTGQQVGMPGFPSFMPASMAQPEQALQAAQLEAQSGVDQYNAQQMGFGGLMGGLGSMVSAALPFVPGWGFSDRRLKDEPVLIGQTEDGHNVYSYLRDGAHEVGVMADELPGEKTDIGLLTDHSMVDYGQVRGFTHE